MALQDLLGTIPGRGAYLAQQQYDQQQQSSGLQQLLGVANFLELQKARSAQQQFQQAQLAELQRKAAQEQEGNAELKSLADHFQNLQQPSVTTDAADNVTQTPGASSDQALRKILPQTLFHASPSVRQVGTQLLGKLEASDARTLAQQAILEQRREAEQRRHEVTLRDATTREERAKETERHNRFQEGINAQMAAMSAERLKHSKTSDEFSDVKKQVSQVMLKILNNQPVTPQERAFLDTWQRMNPISALTRDALSGAAQSPAAAAPAPANQASGPIVTAPQRPQGVPREAVWSQQHNAWVVRKDGKLMKWVPD